MADFQTFLLVKAEQLLVIGAEPFPRKKIAHAAIAKATPLARQIPQALAQGGIICPDGNIPRNTSGKTNKRIGATLTQLRSLLNVSDRLPLGDRRHHFFPTISFSAALSSIASARRRFSRLFSSSSAFNRLASDTSRPP